MQYTPEATVDVRHSQCTMADPIARALAISLVSVTGADRTMSGQTCLHAMLGVAANTSVRK
jgi:hypothetical protein